MVESGAASRWPASSWSAQTSSAWTSPPTTWMLRAWPGWSASWQVGSPALHMFEHVDQLGRLWQAVSVKSLLRGTVLVRHQGGHILPLILPSNSLSQQGACPLLGGHVVQTSMSRRCTCACWPTAQHQKPISSLLRDAVSTFCLSSAMLSASYCSMPASAADLPGLVPAGDWQHVYMPPLTLTHGCCLCRFPRHRSGSHPRPLLPGQRGGLDLGAGQRCTGILWNRTHEDAPVHGISVVLLLRATKALRELHAAQCFCSLPAAQLQLQLPSRWNEQIQTAGMGPYTAAHSPVGRSAPHTLTWCVQVRACHMRAITAPGWRPRPSACR